MASLTFHAGYQLTHMRGEVVPRGHFRQRAQARVPEKVSMKYSSSLLSA